MLVSLLRLAVHFHQGRDVVMGGAGQPVERSVCEPHQHGRLLHLLVGEGGVELA